MCELKKGDTVLFSKLSHLHKNYGIIVEITPKTLIVEVNGCELSVPNDPAIVILV